MSVQKLKHLLLATESRRWARILDCLVVLLGAWAAGIIYFMLDLEVDNDLIQISIWGVIISTPVIAYMMYRVTHIYKIERLAILVLVLSAAFALLVASVESAKGI